jgi:hypothetical protein
MTQWNAFRPYLMGDLQQVWSRLRDDDYREYAAINFTDPDLIEAFLLTPEQQVFTWETEKGPVAILGAGPTGVEGVGAVWAVASQDALPRWRFAVKNTELCLKRLGQGYRVLTNFKDARNTQQIAWLRRLGFVFFKTEDNFLNTQLPFHQFMRIVK